MARFVLITISLFLVIAAGLVLLSNGLSNSDNLVAQNSIQGQPGNTVPDTPVHQVEKSIQLGKRIFINVIESAANTINPRPPLPTKIELYQYALKVINEDRKNHGVSPVVLSNITSAQSHADDMLAGKYFSHWNTDGVKPYVTYTIHGGRGDVTENISYRYTICPSGTCFQNSFDPFKEINDSEYRMIYDDAGSDWGHRDNIINPDHTSVNFGIAYDGDRFYFVEHFENDIINWKTMTLSGNQLHLEGQMPTNYSLYQIAVFADPTGHSLTAQQLDNVAPYNIGHYDEGKLAGIILPQLPQDSYYQECAQGKTLLETNTGQQCTDYATFTNVSQDKHIMDITVNVSKWMIPGLHTAYVFLKKANGDQVPASSVTLEYLK